MQNKTLKQEMLAEINLKEGWVNCHGHFDKAFYISKEELDKSIVSMEENG